MRFLYWETPLNNIGQIDKYQLTGVFGYEKCSDRQVIAKRPVIRRRGYFILVWLSIESVWWLD